MLILLFPQTFMPTAGTHTHTLTSTLAASQVLLLRTTRQSLSQNLARSQTPALVPPHLLLEKIKRPQPPSSPFQSHTIHSVTQSPTVLHTVSSLVPHRALYTDHVNSLGASIKTGTRSQTTTSQTHSSTSFATHAPHRSTPRHQST